MDRLINELELLVRQTFELWDVGWVTFNWRAYTWDHVQRVRGLALTLCRASGGDEMVTELAALLHDLTKPYDGEVLVDAAGQRVVDEQGYWRNAVRAPQRSNAVTALYDRLGQAAGVDLHIEAPEGLPSLWADAQRLEQVLANLLTNALCHTPPGGRVALRVAEEGGRLAFRVEDSGSGIAPEDLPHVFERFYRGDPARSAGDGHTGLGLSIAQGIARAHGGEITVESCPGAGSTFIVTLPTGVARTTPNAPITSSG